jgi:hypothetical protein
MSDQTPTVDHLNAVDYLNEKIALLDEGYHRFLDPIDAEVADDTTCVICDGPCHGEGFKKMMAYSYSYRAFIVCNDCGAAVEF